MLKYLQLTAILTAFLFFSSKSQVSITSTATPYTEDFNSLSNTGANNTTLPLGWAFFETGSNANTNYAADAGGATAGNTYSYGAASATDRAFGTLRSGSLQSVIGVSFVNNSGTTLTSLAITYKGEEWRLGSAGRSDTLQFQFSLDATSLSDGTWIDENTLDFVTPVTTTTGGKDGNAAGNNTTVTSVINGLSVPAGAVFWIRWQDSDATGADDGLAVDDLSIMFSGNPIAVCAAPAAQPTSLVLTPGSKDIDVSFTAAAADEYLVVRSTSSTLSATPANGTVYTEGQAFGGGTVVSAGSSTSFTDAGLTPLTTYYYFVFASNSEGCTGGPAYLTATPLSGNTNTLSLPACAAPAASATGLILTPSNTSVSGTFTASASANRYLVVRSLSASLGANPVNGVTYTAGQSLGNGTVISYETANSFIAAGLTAATQYYFFVFAANGDCSGEPFYRTVALTANVTTTNTSTGVPPGYYNGTASLTCGPLKTALKNIISANAIELTYNPGTWNAFQTTDIHRKDDNSGDAIWDIYSDNPNGPEAYYYVFGNKQCGSVNYDSEGDCYNREHTFPQEWFGSKQYPMYSDLHHVFPVDGWVNGIHASNPYGEVSTPSATTTNGSKSGPNSFGCYNGIVFEPINAYKGDVARAQLYIITRYEDSMVIWKKNGNADNVLNGTLYPALDDWYIQLLLKWNKLDPVSQKEIDRNNAIYALQNNRNPFVDNPDFADSIFKCASYSCVVPVVLMDFNAKLFGSNVQLTWKVNREINFSRYEIEKSTDGVHFISIGTVQGNNASNYNFTDNNLDNSRVFYYRLKMVDIDGKFSFSKVIPIRITNQFTKALVYPNPANSTLTVELKTALNKKGTLTINDIAGRLLLERTVNAAQNKIIMNVQQLPSGRYFLTIQNNNELVNQSFIIVK
ncbi:MAG: endonuclease [Ferruginibacter sp.]